MATRYLLHSSTFRLALIYMVLFGASVLLLLGFIYWSTAAYLTQQTDQTIEAEIAELAERGVAVEIRPLAVPGIDGQRHALLCRRA